MQRNPKLLTATLVFAFTLAQSCYYDEICAATGGEKTPQAADYQYNPAGKPDPFKPFVEKELVVKKRVEKAPPSSIFPLQKVSLDQFNLVGIGGDAKHRLAVVEARENKGRFYLITLGTIIGLHNGKVVEIKNDRIIVEEPSQGKAGRKINKITVKLHKEDEEGTP